MPVECDSPVEVNSLDQPGPGSPRNRRDKLVSCLVWGIWLVMTGVALGFICLTGHNIPFHEDWVMIEQLTGHEPHFWAWVWNQNTDHRNPVPRLVLLGLLRLTGGDFRCGLIFNALSLSAAAAIMMVIARRLRGTRTELADAFFPVLLLHLGHSENLAMMSWQLAFVFPTLLVLLSLLLLVLQHSAERSTHAVLMGACLLLLPLTGANGLLFVPFLSLWALFCGARDWVNPCLRTTNRWTIFAQMGTGTGSLALLGLYFVRYRLSSYALLKSSLVEKLSTAADIAALGPGPGVPYFRVTGWVVTTALVGATLVLLIRALGERTEARRQKWGILLGVTACLMAALGTGAGRTGAKQLFGSLPVRYAILSIPLFCLLFFAWELYGSSRGRRIVQFALFALICLLLPYNTFSGLMYQKAYRRGMRAVEGDIVAGKLRKNLPPLTENC